MSPRNIQSSLTWSFPSKTSPVEPGDRVIGAFRGLTKGPTLVVVGSIHGNEPAGLLAAKRVCAKIDQEKLPVSGEVVLLKGNSRALEKNLRYVDADLNRFWTRQNLRFCDEIKSAGPGNSENRELCELLKTFREVASRAEGKVVFLDLHTTSAEGIPFATIGDTLRNREFASHFPATIVLGLEEQLEGTMLEYLNNLGAVTMGFEAGQHESLSSVEHHEAVIWIAMVAAGNLRREDIPDFERYFDTLKNAGAGQRFVEVRYRHQITALDDFRMRPGFQNFQAIKRGQVLARDRRGEVISKEKGLILLPLYQKLGDDGFFVAREFSRFWLRVSGFLRKSKVGELMHILPGVRQDPVDAATLIVDTRVARILPLQIFHLLGFRRRRWDGDFLIVSRRRFDLTGPDPIALIETSP